MSKKVGLKLFSLVFPPPTHPPTPNENLCCNKLKSESYWSYLSEKYITSHGPETPTEWKSKSVSDHPTEVGAKDAIESKNTTIKDRDKKWLNHMSRHVPWPISGVQVEMHPCQFQSMNDTNKCRWGILSEDKLVHQVFEYSVIFHLLILIRLEALNLKALLVNKWFPQEAFKWTITRYVLNASLENTHTPTQPSS